MRPNTVKALLKAGKPSVGAWMNFPCVMEAEALASVGWDWVCLDVQHTAVGTETMASIFLAIGAGGSIPLARVPGGDPIIVGRALDAGAYGVVVAQVNNKADAEKAVASTKFAPIGIRSSGAGRAEYFAGSDYARYANEEMLCIPMIEHIEAVENVEEILSVPGVDGCFIGPWDLAMSMGMAFDWAANADKHAAAVKKVLDAGKKLGVPTGIHCGSPEEVNQRIEAGFQFLAAANDASFMLKTARDFYSKIKRAE
jgi:4-hydroxy-2-oxoheptanedioate aldolase